MNLSSASGLNMHAGHYDQPSLFTAVNIRRIYRADEKELRMFDFLTEKELSRLIDKDWEYSDNTINECIKNDIDIIPLCSDSYPGRLKEIAAPPVVLFKKGILPDEKAFHANIVGTRYPDTSGRGGI